MPSHQERVRRQYACHVCDGEGRVSDYDYDGPCSTCDGSGVLLKAREPVKQQNQLPATWLDKELLDRVAASFKIFSSINRSYDEKFVVGDTVRIPLKVSHQRADRPIEAYVTLDKPKGVKIDNG